MLNKAAKLVFAEKIGQKIGQKTFSDRPVSIHCRMTYDSKKLPTLVKDLLSIYQGKRLPSHEKNSPLSAIVSADMTAIS